MSRSEASPVEVGVSAVGSLGALLEAMRPKQWTKNAVVFAAFVFGGKLFDVRSLLTVAAATVLFCLTSSTVYLFNDLLDADADRHHPLKQKRPIASGRLSPAMARVAIAALLLITLPIAALIDPLFAAVLVAYLALMLAYTFRLKHMVIIDVFVIAAGFVLRATAGAVVIHVPISAWLYVCTVLLSLFIGFAKRRHELVLLDDNAAAHRRILDDYSPELLDQLIVIVSAATIMAYSLYTFSASNLPANHAMMLTIPFVVYGVFRYLFLVHRKNSGGAPEQVLLDDLPLLGSLLLWGVVAAVILYFPWH